VTSTYTTSALFGCENWFLCQIPRFQLQYNVPEYRHSFLLKKTIFVAFTYLQVFCQKWQKGPKKNSVGKIFKRSVKKNEELSADFKSMKKLQKTT
jgi:hypothetical protein